MKTLSGAEKDQLDSYKDAVSSCLLEHSHLQESGARSSSSTPMTARRLKAYQRSVGIWPPPGRSGCEKRDACRKTVRVQTEEMAGLKKDICGIVFADSGFSLGDGTQHQKAFSFKRDD